MPGGGLGRAAFTRATSRATCSIGVSGRMPWPRLKMKGPEPERLEDRPNASIKMRSAGDEEQRVEIALHGDEALQSVPDPADRQARVAADGIDAGSPRIAFGKRP